MKARLEVIGVKQEAIELCGMRDLFPVDFGPKLFAEKRDHLQVICERRPAPSILYLAAQRPLSRALSTILLLQQKEAVAGAQAEASVAVEAPVF